MKNRPFIVTCVFAVVFVIAHFMAAVMLCRERCFLDTAYYFFHVLNEETFRVEHQRIILVLSQVLLWAGVKMHLSFHSLFVAYSITPIVYLSVLLFISLYFFRSEAAAWMLICCSIIGNYFLYYSPMYEVCYAIVTFGFLWFLTVRGYYQSLWQALVYATMLTVCLMGYPVISIGCVALLSYMWIYEGKLPKRLLVIYAVVFTLWFLVKIFLISDYEKAHVTLKAPPSKVQEVVGQVFSLGYAVDTLWFTIVHYFVPFAAVMIISFFSFKDKKYWQGLWSIIGLLVLLIIMNLKAGGDGLVPTIHNERSYLILVPICIAPLLFCFYDRWSRSMALICVLVLMADTVYESVRIWQHSSYYALRIAQMNKLIDHSYDTRCVKIATPIDSLAPELDEWTTGMEVMLYSSERGRTVVWTDREVYDTIKAQIPIDRGHFLMSINLLPIQELNPRYFKLDSSEYCFEK